MDEDKAQHSQLKYQEQADDMFFEIIETKRKYLPVKSAEPSTVSKSEPCKSGKFPPIKLPVISGEFKDFPGFIDLFNTMVHRRTDLSNVEKFQYLITSLTGDPINIIRAYTVNDANYHSAYKALVNRYNNKRYLAFMCWEQINNLKALSSSSASGLRSMLDTYNENVSMQNSLGLPTTQWDFVLFHSLLTKLDKTSREAFELSQSNSEFPSFRELVGFLVERCNALELSTLNVNISSSSAASQQSNKQMNINNQSKQTMFV